MPKVADVRCTKESITVLLVDGRAISAPLAWFPRLAAASPEQLRDWQPCASGEGLHWREIDEDISIAALLAHG